MAGSDDCPFCLIYQHLAPVTTGHLAVVQGASWWSLSLPQHQPKMSAPMSACITVREAFQWPVSPREGGMQVPVFAKAVAQGRGFEAVPYKHIGVSSAGFGTRGSTHAHPCAPSHRTCRQQLDQCSSM